MIGRGVDGRALSMLLSSTQRQVDLISREYENARMVYGPQGRCVWVSRDINVNPTGIKLFGHDHSLRVMVYGKPDERSESGLPDFLHTGIFTDPWFFVVGVETEKDPYFDVWDWQNKMRVERIPDAFIAKIQPEITQAIKDYDRRYR